MSIESVIRSERYNSGLRAVKSIHNLSRALIQMPSTAYLGPVKCNRCRRVNVPPLLNYLTLFPSESPP